MAEITTLERLARVDMDGELGAMIEAVTFATTRGAPKYNPHIGAELARRLVCRAYGGMVYELVHLTAAAEMADPERGYGGLLWDNGPATAGGFRKRFADALANQPRGPIPVRPDANGIRIAFTDGSFTIAYSRMPLLCAMLDFLVAAIGYGAVDDAVKDALQPPVRRAALSRAANRLSRDLYDFLKPRLPSVQAQRKFRTLMAFLQARSGVGAVRLEDLDDPAVLDFWKTRSAGPDADDDWKTFRTVFSTFTRLFFALKASRDHAALERAKPLGSDSEAGEVDPADVHGACVAYAGQRAPLDVLRSAPANEIKFLGKSEMDALEPLLAAGDAAGALPLSVLRAEVFGNAQAAISQHLRRGKAPADAVAAAQDNSLESYDKTVARGGNLLAKMSDSLHASYHALAKARHGDAITLLLQLNPEMDLKPLAALISGAGDGADVTAMNAAALRENFFDHAASGCKECPELATFAARAAAAHGRITRKGFGAADIHRPAIAEGFAQGSAALAAIMMTVERLHARLLTRLPKTADRERLFIADRDSFFVQFRRIYGAQS